MSIARLVESNASRLRRELDAKVGGGATVTDIAARMGIHRVALAEFRAKRRRFSPAMLDRLETTLKKI